MTELEKAKEAVCDAGRRLTKKGLVARTWGNISLRVGRDSFVITPSGRPYEELTSDDIVLVNIGDLSYQGEVKPSSEKGVHAEAYKLRDDVNAVIHTHQNEASTVAAARREITLTAPEQKALFGPSVRTSDYGLPGTKKLKKAAAKALEGRNAALLANHGAVCVGSTMEEAFQIAEKLETLCGEFIASEFKKKTKKNPGSDHEGLYDHFVDLQKRRQR